MSLCVCPAGIGGIVTALRAETAAVVETNRSLYKLLESRCWTQSRPAEMTGSVTQLSVYFKDTLINLPLINDLWFLNYNSCSKAVNFFINSSEVSCQSLCFSPSVGQCAEQVSSGGASLKILKTYYIKFKRHVFILRGRGCLFVSM